MTSKLIQRTGAIVLMTMIVPVLATALAAAPREPGWSNHIFVTGHERAVVKSTPIEMRPYRPMHVYGNTVRHRYYRSGPATPAPRYIAPRYVAPSVFSATGIR